MKAWVVRDSWTGLFIGRDGMLTRHLSQAALFTSRRVCRIAAERFSLKYGVSISGRSARQITVLVGAKAAA